MDLTNEFTVPVPVERAWEVLNDVELIAPCLPGAQLQEIEGDEYRGVVKVKVGPITAQYKGAATFQEQDEANRKIVLKAEGRDTRGQGSASALITATMTESGSGPDVSTHVVVESDVTIKGKVAQFGRGMIAEVSAKLLTQFVECLEGKLEADPSGDTPGDDAAEAAKAQSDVAAATSEPTGATDGDDVATVGDPAAEAAKQATDAGADDTAGKPKVRKIEQEASAPVDLLDSAGAPVAKRLAPLVAIVAVLLLLGKRRSKKRKG